jgi:hypothetical protein
MPAHQCSGWRAPRAKRLPCPARGFHARRTHCNTGGKTVSANRALVPLRTRRQQSKARRGGGLQGAAAGAVQRQHQVAMACRARQSGRAITGRTSVAADLQRRPRVPLLHADRNLERRRASWRGAHGRRGSRQQVDGSLQGRIPSTIVHPHLHLQLHRTCPQAQQRRRQHAGGRTGGHGRHRGEQLACQLGRSEHAAVHLLHDCADVRRRPWRVPACMCCFSHASGLTTSHAMHALWCGSCAACRALGQPQLSPWTVELTETIATSLLFGLLPFLHIRSSALNNERLTEATFLVQI